MDEIFKPNAIAVIGASNTPESVGHALIKNLIGSGYLGTVYPINYKHKSIYGVRSYASIKETRDQIDLAIIATPAASVPDLVMECGEYGVKGIVIISAGFLEIGEKGKRMVRDILETARKYNIRIIGPNCLGFIKPSLNLNASFANKMALPGKIAFISQSGALCTAILDWSVEQNVGFSHFVSIGSMVDVGFHDLIDYFGRDPDTNSIVIYMESLTHARKFMSAARAFARTKPIIVLKAGKSAQGAKVALSHTGTLAGNDQSYAAAFKRAGIISVNTIEELFNAAQTLAMQPRPKGKRLAIVTNAGGPGVLATDHLVGLDGELAELSESAIQHLNGILSPAWSHRNPVDVLGDAGAEQYGQALQACLKDDHVDGVLVILTPQAMTKADEIAATIVEISKKTNKTILASWMGEKDVEAGREILENGNIPNFRIPENAVNTFMNMYSYTRNIEELYETPKSIPDRFSPNTADNRKLVREILDSGRTTFNELEAKIFLERYQIPITHSRVVNDRSLVLRTAKEIGYPVAMKIVSPDILHKTNIGGVKLNLHTEQEVLDAYEDITQSAKNAFPDAHIEGVLVEQMVQKKYELLIGAQKDPLFGPIIVFGMGGVAVEVFKDINVGLPPLNMALAKRLIEDTKIYELLKGFRGMPPVDINSIQFLLYKFTYLLIDFPEIKEIDINPFAVDESGGVVLDAKIVLDPDYQVDPKNPYAHLVISPYPKELTFPFQLRNGKEVLIRPIMPEDEIMEKEMFSHLSKQSQYYRFFGYVPDVSHDMLTRFTQIDYDREIALVAEIRDERKRKITGVVRLVADSTNEKAEFAIVVADPWQGQGLGNKLADLIMDIAKQRGIKQVYANVLNANTIMLHMFRKRGFKIVNLDHESVLASYNLQPEMQHA